jgi:hypothetical protein
MIPRQISYWTFFSRNSPPPNQKGKKDMKKLLVVLIIGYLLSPTMILAQTKSWEIRPAYPDLGQPLGSQGSYENPYVVKEGRNGDLEIRSKYPDLNKPIGSPGSPENPYIIKPRKW